jgi:hypothetical protein
MSLPSTRQFVLIGSVILALAACSQQDAPAQAIEAYLQALVDKDADRLVTLSCADWEEQATMEVDSFEAVSATLKDANCQTSGQEGDATLVTCTGSIVATYNDEQQELGLDRQVYRVVSEGGEWRMCGYQ